jgi:hypothetical protein
MLTPDRKVRKLMEEYQKTGNLSKSALRADMDPKTARKYLGAGKLPSECRAERYWRTREDPFSEQWSEAKAMLEVAPELEAKILFEWLCERYPGVFQEGQLRTFQRRVREWRALEGPPKEVYFPQAHEPGKKMETDFTRMNELEITIAGEPYPHLLCHCVLPYSNWQWATVCHSESLLALRKGLQAALLRLGRVPLEHWTDNTTGATHAIVKGKEGPRGFNDNYKKMTDHFGMEPRTINIAKPHENGDVESANNALKRRIKQHLLLRGHRDFPDVASYITFLHGVLEKANALRCRRLSEELAVMPLLDVRLLPEYVEEEVGVSSWSTIHVARNTYSVPSRLIGESVRARRYEDRIEVFYHGIRQLIVPRLFGEGKHTINYRHVIDWLVRKPGAFQHYRYRQEMFPTLEFRWAYDALCGASSNRVADLEYLRILHHAAQTMESVVQRALSRLREEGEVPRWNLVIERAPTPRPQVPSIPAFDVKLEVYDELLGAKEVSA